MFTNLKTGLIYRNPKPHVHSVHAYFPLVVQMDNGELLATLVLGEAFEAANCRTHLARSRDNGETWQMEGCIYPGTEGRLTSDSSRITFLPGGEVVVFMVRHDRTDYPEEGLTNPVNMGFVPTELLILHSRDYGRTWEGPKPFKPPFEGQSFEMCCPITPLKDGRWLLPTSTWCGWDGNCPNGRKMVAFVSRDRGASWPKYLDVMVDPKQEIVYWESKIIELGDGRLLSVAWAYNEKRAKDLPDQYVLSKDGGKTWSKPLSTGLIGQTLTPFLLDDNRILSVYRRMDKSGLWANLSHLEGERWVNDGCASLWGHNVAGLTTSSENMSHNFNVLRFGSPCITRLSDGTIFTAFWCYEDCVSVIRWFKFNL
ncbi:MAG: sialidase family protein [Candidatus Omnitrophota bacterium]|nr:glycoside hydrolase [Candidatus Omnitrophota bacterium]